MYEHAFSKGRLIKTTNDEQILWGSVDLPPLQ